MLTAPWWKLALIQGTFFGACMAFFTRLLTDASDVFADHGIPLIITALLYGTIFGVIMGRITAAANRDTMAVADLDDPDELRQAARAATRGPIPADPRIRHAAHKIAVQRLVQFEGQRKFSLIAFAVAIPAYLAMTFWISRWWIAAAPWFVVMLAITWREPDRLARRVLDLGPSEDVSEGPGEHRDEDQRHHQADHE